jgi:PAP2 superfamily
MNHHPCPENGDHAAARATDLTPRDPRPDADRTVDLASPSRRQFLAAAGALTAATMAASTVGAASPRAVPPPSTTSSLRDRRARALEIRQQAALYQLDQAFPVPQTNGDEGRYPAGVANYSKALPHNALGEVDPYAYQRLWQAIHSRTPSAFEAVPLGGTARLANPQGAFAFELEGADPHALTVQAPPRFADEAFAGEMVECYWLALARDIPYAQYGKEPVTAAAINDLKRFSGYEGVNAGNLFRGDFPGLQIGPYLSQFLLQSYLLGTTPVEQRYRTPLPGLDHPTAYQDWLEVQNGEPVPVPASFDEEPRYLRNGRDLGEWVHRDFTYQGALVAALILLGYGREALDEANPYQGSSTQAGFTTFGGPHVLDLIARVANHALKAAWYHKWVVHRRLRPEEFGGRIHHHLTGAARYPIHATLLNSPALDLVFRKYGTYLCPQAYPEGCPTHPAFPGGHASFIGAGVTVLKAFFNEAFVIPNPVVPSDDGLSLQPWTGEPLTVGHELNKLAFNVAFGRDTAGVHFRRDELEGIVLGEATAFSVLTDANTTYHENFEGFSLTTFDGEAVTLDVNPAP